MAYNQNIPQPGDQLSQSQSDLLNNFQAIQTLIDVNHVDFAASGAGKHKWVSLPQQGSAPGTAAAEGALYTAAIAGVTQLLFQTPSNGTSLQLTGPTALGANGYTTLPGGLILQWGTATTTSGFGTITFPIAFPTAAYAVMVCSAHPPASGTTGVVVDAVSTSLNTTTCQIQAFIGSLYATTVAYYFALGH
jgi:hypothetical protein